MALTKSFLESRSTGELFALADELGLCLPEDLNRRLVIGEILDCYHSALDLNPPCAPHSLESKGTSCAYNTTEIHILARDPLWFFVFWDIHEQLFCTLTQSPQFRSFFLRVHSLGGHGWHTSLDHFDIDVPLKDRKRYVHLSLADDANRIDLCCKMLQRERILAQSRVVTLQRSVIERSLNPEDPTGAEVLSLCGLPLLEETYPSTSLPVCS